MPDRFAEAAEYINLHTIVENLEESKASSPKSEKDNDKMDFENSHESASEEEKISSKKPDINKD